MVSVDPTDQQHLVVTQIRLHVRLLLAFLLPRAKRCVEQPAFFSSILASRAWFWPWYQRDFHALNVSRPLSPTLSCLVSQSILGHIADQATKP